MTLGFYRGIRVPLREGQTLSPHRGWSSRRKPEKSGWSFGFRSAGPDKGGRGTPAKAVTYRYNAPAVRERKAPKPSLNAAGKTTVFYRPGTTSKEELPSKGIFAPSEERVPSSRRRGSVPRWGAWALKAGLFAVLGACVVWSKGRTTALLQDLAGLHLSKVTVEGNRYLEEDEVIKAARLPMGESMFKLDLGRTAAALEALPWVEKVFIERRLPSSVVIDVKERRPVALVEKGAIFGLDGQGRILNPTPALAGEDLPLISGVDFPPEALGTTAEAQVFRGGLDFLDFVRKEDPVLAQSVSEVNLSEPGLLQVTFIDGLEARFDQKVTETQLQRMAMVLSDLSQKGRRAGRLDFRFKDTVLVKVRD